MGTPKTGRTGRTLLRTILLNGDEDEDGESFTLEIPAHLSRTGRIEKIPIRLRNHDRMAVEVRISVDSRGTPEVEIVRREKPDGHGRRDAAVDRALAKLNAGAGCAI